MGNLSAHDILLKLKPLVLASLIYHLIHQILSSALELNREVLVPLVPVIGNTSTKVPIEIVPRNPKQIVRARFSPLRLLDRSHELFHYLLRCLP